MRIATLLMLSDANKALSLTAPCSKKVVLVCGVFQSLLRSKHPAITPSYELPRHEPKRILGIQKDNSSDFSQI